MLMLIALVSVAYSQRLHFCLNFYPIKEHRRTSQGAAHPLIQTKPLFSGKS